MYFFVSTTFLFTNLIYLLWQIKRLFYWTIHKIMIQNKCKITIHCLYFRI